VALITTTFEEPKGGNMEKPQDAFHAFLESLLPKALKPYSSAIFLALAFIGALVLSIWAYGFDFLFVLGLGILGLLGVILAWVVLSELIKKPFK
jgi:hypothetical protein